jgi:hypothetical protein
MQMLLMAGARERTEEQFEKLLADSGFRRTAVVPIQSFMSVVEAVTE